NNAKNGNFRQKSAVCEIKIHLEITGQDLGIKSENYFSFGITVFLFRIRVDSLRANQPGFNQ
ncbi:MAG: hypothetical protein PHV82_03440, partial [Victivallaceae bacterium]|nr:hypothetical protein [Victivallaceae bacterium]